MNQRPLDEIIREAVDRVLREGAGPLDEEAVAERVLQDPDIQILRHGYDMHDRSEGLEDVFVRDVRRKVGETLGESDASAS